MYIVSYIHMFVCIFMCKVKDENELTLKKTNNYIFYETYRKIIIYEQNNVENKINKH